MAIPVNRISYLPLLQGLDEKALADIAVQMVARNHPRGGVVFHKGDPAESMTFVLQGKLQAIDLSEDGRALGISTFQVGDFFGEMGVIDGLPRSTTIVALEQSEVAHLPRPMARQIILQYPRIAERIMIRLSQMVRVSANQIALLSIPNAYQRVFLHIYSIAEQNAQQNKIRELPKQHEIAGMVNTSRETVSRAIHLLMKSGVIQKQGQSIIIRKPEQLRRAAENGHEALMEAARMNQPING
jgi:CRP/FNR family cyclic AMP-dependent transcriptional regulator